MDIKLSDVTFREIDLGGTTTRVVVGTIALGGEYTMPVGAITFDRERFTIELLIVQKHFRRKGIADALLRAANEIAGRDLVPGSDASPLGKKFIRKHYGSVPRRIRSLDAREAEAMGARLLTAIQFALLNDHEEGAA